jgi:hypothetical protein
MVVKFQNWPSVQCDTSLNRQSAAFNRIDRKRSAENASGDSFISQKKIKLHKPIYQNHWLPTPPADDDRFKCPFFAPLQADYSLFCEEFIEEYSHMAKDHVYWLN